MYKRTHHAPSARQPEQAIANLSFFFFFSLTTKRLENYFQGYMAPLPKRTDVVFALSMSRGVDVRTGRLRNIKALATRPLLGTCACTHSKRVHVGNIYASAKSYIKYFSPRLLARARIFLKNVQPPASVLGVM